MPRIWDPYNDMPSLDGKVAVVTGATYVLDLCPSSSILTRTQGRHRFPNRETSSLQRCQSVLHSESGGQGAEGAGRADSIEPSAVSVEQLPWALVEFDKIETAAAAAAEISSKEEKIDILGRFNIGQFTGPH